MTFLGSWFHKNYLFFVGKNFMSIGWLIEAIFLASLKNMNSRKNKVLLYDNDFS